VRDFGNKMGAVTQPTSRENDGEVSMKLKMDAMEEEKKDTDKTKREAKEVVKKEKRRPAMTREEELKQKEEDDLAKAIAESLKLSE
jgi:hypothetical protein